MYFFDTLLFNIITITYPLFLYLFYSIKKKNLNEKKSKTILDISLLSSFFICLYFNNSLNKNEQMIFLTLPILFSFLYKRTSISIFMSIVIIDLLFTKNNYTVFGSIILVTLYYVLYNIYLRKTFSNKKFINIYSVINASFYLFFNILYLKNSEEVIVIVSTSIIYFIVNKIIACFIKKENEMLDIYLAMRDVEKEDHIQTSLFKITHEIKNPLAVVKGYINLFDVNNPEKSKRYIDIINNEVDRSLELLNDFKDLSRVNVIKKDMNIIDLFDDIKETMVPLFKAKKIKYEIKCESDITINADYNRMKQVLVNLIKNSIEASNKEKGLITLTIFYSNSSLYIIVKDNGEGMDKDTLEKIFTPFYTTKHYGTGLGVCLSKEIIEAHNGSLSYTSIPNKCTIAKIVLPI